MSKYNHKQIEKKWQHEWEKQGLYETKDNVRGKKNYYALVEFPYPSGNLHIGHWYAFSVPDIFARYKRMQGLNVLFPVGFDSFGLPAENAAIKNRINPKKWTYGNISRMEAQLRSMGASFDWSRQIITSDPEYYKWTQWLFLKLYEKGLAYKKRAIVNWDPVDKTVLANEQILPDGTAERSGAIVEKKELEQWFLKITDYAERLLKDLDGLSWPEEIKQSQREWIGKSEGALIQFPISNFQFPIDVFTTRPDTLFGVTYLVLAPEHEEISNLKSQISNREDVERYVEKAKRKSEKDRMAGDKEKTGVELKGVKAINPANKEEISIWVADYVLCGYGTGAIMAVPAHDERDFEFAVRHNLPIRQVVASQVNADSASWQHAEEGEKVKKAHIGTGTMINSGMFNGLENEKAKEKITQFVGGKKKTTYKLRDWLISRQRYWGCPIPIVYDTEGRPHPISEEHLPWLLSEDVDFTPTGEPPLASSKELKKRTEKIFGKKWLPEYDTLDTFVDSSWYFLRYIDPKNSKELASKEKLKNWMPIARYSGGAEHTTMHLLYSRFFHKALFDLGIVNENEPYLERMNRGIILGKDGRKMSKRWGNVIDPDEQVKTVGADSVRMYLAFIGPYNVVGHYPWDIGGIVGVRRFLERVWRDCTIYPSKFLTDKEGEKQNERELHRVIKSQKKIFRSLLIN